MQKITTTNVSKNDLKLRTEASALIKYAEGDKEFSESLAHYIQNQSWYNSSAELETAEISAYAVPTKQAEAVRNSNWLLQQLDENGTLPSTKNVLSTWAKHYENPKAIAIGIIGIMIMGPTLGIVEKTKKKKKAHLQIVIEKVFYNSLSKIQLAELVQTTSQKLIAKELREASGNVYKLHPDTAEWCLDEPSTKVFVDEKKNIEKMHKLITEERLSHLSTNNQKVIAVSPNINDEFVDESGAELCK